MRTSTVSTTRSSGQPPKLSRSEAIALVKQEEPSIDFGLNDVHAACSLSQLDYLNRLSKNMRYKPSPDTPGSIGRAVYEYLCRHKFMVYQLFTKGIKDHWITTSKWMQVPTSEYVFFTLEAANLALVQLRASQPDRKHKFLHLYLTQAEYDKKWQSQ